MAANLNDLSGGRLVLGVGVGWAQARNSTRSACLPRARPADRRVPARDPRRLAGRAGLPERADPALDRRQQRRGGCAGRCGWATPGTRCGSPPAGWPRRRAADGHRRRAAASAARADAAHRAAPDRRRRSSATTGWPVTARSTRSPRTSTSCARSAPSTVVLDPFNGDPRETAHPEDGVAATGDRSRALGSQQESQDINPERSCGVTHQTMPVSASRRRRPGRPAHLRRCVELAAEAVDAGDFPFGSVLVAADGRVLAEDRNRENTWATRPGTRSSSWPAGRRRT